MTRRIRRPLAAFAVLLATGLMALVVASDHRSDQADGDVNRGTSVPTTSRVVSDITIDDLAKVARTRVFFGHQSVGGDVLGGIPAVYARHGVPVPPLATGMTPGETGGAVVHALIGRNEQPLGKIEDFDAAIRGGLGRQVDVAMMKFCYVDITAGTDVDALFAVYRDTLAALERDYPQVTFVAVTVPLTTEQGLRTRFEASVKRLLGREPRRGRDENVARERLNALIRGEYADDHLFDLAAVESTAPDGHRVSGSHDGRPYFALHRGYARDEGHLNPEGARVAATAWLAAVARASAR